MSEVIFLMADVTEVDMPYGCTTAQTVHLWLKPRQTQGGQSQMTIRGIKAAPRLF